MLSIGVLSICIVIAVAFLGGPIVSNVEQARYTVAEANGKIELRDYAPMIVAETYVPGAREPAIGQGFRVIADYIFGNNALSQKVAMTAPVMQQHQRIAGTGPVTQQDLGKHWQVRFVMPASYTIATLPQPNNAGVKLIEIPARRYAVIRFSGLATEDELARQTTTLTSYLETHHLTAISNPTYAFYNPPWTLPFLRRNEVMVEISR